MTRSRDFRRWRRQIHMWRRVKEDRNQHNADKYYVSLYSIPISEAMNTKFHCECWWDPKRIAQFAEQPKLCSCYMCGNQRKYGKGQNRLSWQERRMMPLTSNLKELDDGAECN